MEKVSNVMQDIDEMKNNINSYYDITVENMNEIKANSENLFNLISNSFMFGYLQGVIAEKARQKNVKINIAEKLTELRGNKTQEEIAKGLGISIAALTAYENAERIPRDELKLKIADYYNISIQNIF